MCPSVHIAWSVQPRARPSVHLIARLPTNVVLLDSTKFLNDWRAIPIDFPHLFNVAFLTEVNWKLPLVMVLAYKMVHCSEALLHVGMLLHVRQMAATQLVEVSLATPWTCPSAYEDLWMYNIYA